MLCGSNLAIYCSIESDSEMEKKWPISPIVETHVFDNTKLSSGFQNEKSCAYCHRRQDEGWRKDDLHKGSHLQMVAHMA